MLRLFGSTTSPFVRQLRIWMANIDHEFINMQIFAGKDRQVLAERNPTLKIPMLEDGAEVIYDSRVIFRYLTDKFSYPLPSWEQENHLTLIDAATDSLVQMLLLERSELDTKSDAMYFKLQRERVDATLAHLNGLVEQGHFENWHYPSICLYCLIDWIEFRTLHDLSEQSALLQFKLANSERIETTATDPRN